MPERIASHFKTVGENILYKKPANHISAGNTCSTISDHPIQFLTEQKSSFKQDQI